MIIRLWFYIISILSLLAIGFIYLIWPPILYALVIVLPLILIGLYDVIQPYSNVLRNYPVWGHWRYILLSIRPQIQQYFIATNQSGRPFNKEMRDLVYERATGMLDTIPFGTQRDVDVVGYEWINHSLSPKKAHERGARIRIGNSQCTKPYLASRLNVSAMSFGALSQNAVRALNRGAKIGNFAHNTGEGGLSRYHLMEGGDIIWQIGTGYFGCKTKDCNFDPELFKEKSRHEHVKMIEIKLSQGAKPAHGGILPGAKVTQEIAQARHVDIGEDCISPPAHTAFSTPIGLLEYIQQLRELSGGKPVGFKLCLGVRSDFMAICKAMLETKIYPDFITVDGAEGGTGAAPVEFTDSLGTPLNDGLIFVHNCLVGINVREHIRLIASGKIISGFDMASKIALGADLCNSARGMLFALGCIQSRRCHNNTCPTGITTQDPYRMFALSVDKKAPHVANFHNATIQSFLEVLGAAGLEHPEQLTPGHVHRRVTDCSEPNYDQIYTYLPEGSLLEGSNVPDIYQQYWESSQADEFASLNNAFGKYWRAKKNYYVRKWEH
ncbi:MAG: FMN-binding glutamate synthase family protein [Gammaproteobacteria bacterium]